MTEYVAGFLFDEEGRRVVMVRKNKPQWQVGLLNGVGGKIEGFDNSPVDAMRREFREEAGLDISQWNLFATIGGDWGAVWFFRAFVPVEVLEMASSMEDEEIEIVDVDNINLGVDTLANLTWIFPLALYRHDEYEPVHAQEIVSTFGE